MWIEEALEFFTKIPKIRRRLQTLHDVGLHRHPRGEETHRNALHPGLRGRPRPGPDPASRPPPVIDEPDPFEATRRIESAQPAAALPLADMVPGYAHNVEAARRTLTWLTEHYETSPAIVAAIRQLTRPEDPFRPG